MNDILHNTGFLNSLSEPVAIVDIYNGELYWNNLSFETVFCRKNKCNNNSEAAEALRELTTQNPAIQTIRQAAAMGVRYSTNGFDSFYAVFARWRGQVSVTPVHWKDKKALALSFSTAVTAARQREALQQLSSDPVISSGRFEEAARSICVTAAESLGCCRVGIWLAEGFLLRNVAAYNRIERSFSFSEIFDMREFPGYAEMILNNRFVVINDMENENDVDISNYFTKFNVRAVLDCPIRLRGQFLGVICVEHELPRNWTQEDINFAVSMADFAVIALESRNLFESERRIQTLISNLPGTAFRCRIDFPFMTMEYVSEGCYEIFGYTQEEFTETPINFADLIHPEDLPKIWEMTKDTLLEDRQLDIAYRIFRKDGEVRWIWERSRLVDTGNPSTGDLKKSFTIIEGYFGDITQRRQLEEADLANKAKGDFLANMSHEIRTPLNAVLGLCTMLLDIQDDAVQRQYTEEIKRSADSLLDMIESILDFTKLKTGELKLEAVEFSPRHIIEDTCEIFSRSIREKGLKFAISIEFPPTLGLQGDPNRLRQLLIKLIDNAIKFTPTGHIGVVGLCKPAEDDPQKQILVIEIEDSGIGISEEALPKLFEMFTQGDSSTSRRYGGTGVGLAICKALSKLMGGIIDVVSRPGIGSVFQLEIPFETAKDRSELSADFASCSVLVYHAYSSTRHLIGDLLKTWNISVQEADSFNAFSQSVRTNAADGAEGKKPFDILFVDLDGIDNQISRFQTEIGQYIDFTQTSLCLLVPFGQAFSIDKFNELNGSDIVSVPVKSEDLLTTIRRLFSGKISAKEIARKISLEPLHILLAEDTKINRIVAVTMLEGMGHSVNAVENGRLAIEALRENDYDLVLMDCQMPELDGYKATQMIRTTSSGIRNPNIPIIAFTAHAMSGDRDKCIEAGMNDYIAKPIHSEELLTCLEFWSRKIRETVH